MENSHPAPQDPELLARILPVEPDHYTKDGQLHPTVAKRIKPLKQKKERTSVSTCHVAAAAAAAKAATEPKGVGAPGSVTVPQKKRKGVA